MGPQPPKPHTLLFPAAPIIGSRPSASRRPAAPACGGRGPARSLTARGRLTRIGNSRVTGAPQAPVGTPAGQSGMPVIVREPGQEPQTRASRSWRQRSAASAPPLSRKVASRSRARAWGPVMQTSAAPFRGAWLREILPPLILPKPPYVPHCALRQRCGGSDAPKKQAVLMMLDERVVE